MRLALALLVAAVLLLAGCAGRPAAHLSATPAARTTTFTSKELRFSVTFDASKIVSPGLVFNPGDWDFAQVSFQDKDPKDHPFPASLGDSSGPPGGPSGCLVVVVWRQPSENQAPSSTDLHDMLATSFAAHVMSNQKGVAATTAVPVVYNGLPGYRSALSWKSGDSVTYILYKKPLIYELELTVAEAAQPSSRDALMAAMRSFEVTQ
jgi:hypothetical protein